MNPQQPVFSEREAAEIVQLAVELQEGSTELASAYTPGITLEELRRVAGEVGVADRFLEEAIRQKQEATQHADASYGAFQGKFEKVIEGELEPGDFDLLLDDLKAQPNQPGPSQVGSTLKARTMVGIVMANVTITSRNGRTRLRIDYSNAPGCLILAYPAAVVTFFAFLGGNAAGAPWLGLLFALLVVWGAVRASRGLKAQYRKQIEELGLRLEGKIRAAMADNDSNSTARSPESRSDVLRETLN